jgi:hypothetical protein
MFQNYEEMSAFCKDKRVTIKCGPMYREEAEKMINKNRKIEENKFVPVIGKTLIYGRLKDEKFNMLTISGNSTKKFSREVSTTASIIKLIKENVEGPVIIYANVQVTSLNPNIHKSEIEYLSRENVSFNYLERYSFKIEKEL